MEKETSTSNGSVITSSEAMKQSQSAIISRMNEIADFVKEKYGANIWFVEIMGKRHSYIAGHKEDSFLPPEVVYLNERYAIVSNEWEKIKEKEAILTLCKVFMKE